MTSIVSQERYESLVDDCRAIITETVFNSRWTLVSGYHMLGERLRQEASGQSISKLLPRVAVDLGKRERLLWQAVQFYDRYPNLDLLPGGKNVSWHKIVNELLPEPKEEDREVCPTCGRKMPKHKGDK